MASPTATERPAARAVIVAPDSSIRRIGLIVTALSTAVFVWFASTGQGSLLEPDPFGAFFDIQARAMMHGHLDLPERSLRFEGFEIDGRTYTYFGVFPSLIRMPVLLVTSRFDGRLTGVSMTIAHVIGMWASVLILERVHRLVRPGHRWTRPGKVLVGTVLVAVGLGSNLMYSASRAWVYHEAGLWGAAGVLAAFAAILDFETRPRTRPIVVAGCWTAVAWLSRGSTGLGPSLVLGLLGLAHLTRAPFVQSLVPRPRAAPRLPTDSASDPESATDGGVDDEAPRWPRRPRLAVAMIVAAAAGGVLFGAINTAKFGSPMALPFDKQVASRLPWPDRTRAIDEYGGDLLSPSLIPANLVQALRPDLLTLSHAWPGVRYVQPEPVEIFDPVYDTVEPTAGLTLTVPALLVLTVVGLVAAARRRHPYEGTDPPGDAAVLRPYLLGGALGSVAAFSIAFASQRYLTDVLPLLVVGSAGGVVVIDRWATVAGSGRRQRTSRARRQRRVRAAVGALIALTVFGVLANLAVTWLFQRVVAPKDPATRLSGLQARVTAHDLLGFRVPPLIKVDEAPKTVEEGKILVVGECKAMYWGAGGTWFPLEVTRSAGHHRLHVELDGPIGPTPVPLLSIGEPDQHLVIAVQPIDGDPDRARVVAFQNGELTARGQMFELDDLTDAELDVWIDRVVGGVNVSIGDRWSGGERALLFRPSGPPKLGPSTPGANPFGGPVASAFPGVVQEQPIDRSTCRDVLEASTDDD